MTPPRIRLAGDHSAYHCGSAAVFETLRLRAAAHGIIAAPDAEYDLLIVNGEGSMHHDSGDCRAKMHLLRAALDAGKQAWLVNSLWQENGPAHDDVLRRLGQIVVREGLSQRDLRDRHGVASTVRLDFSYDAPIDETAPAQDWSGQVMATDFLLQDERLWFRVTRGPLANRGYIDMRDGSWSALVRSLRSCRAIVTGRHHAVYAACVARRPFVAVAGNSHKVEGLIATSRFPIPVLTRLRDTQASLRWAIANRGMYAEFFDWMAAQPKWTPGAG